MVFMEASYQSSVDFVFNPLPTITKTFKTISYTGSNGWQALNITTDKTGIDSNPQYPALGDTQADYPGLSIASYDRGYYVDTNTNIAYRAGFDRKQNVYYAPLKGTNTNIPQQVLQNNLTTGIKGMFLNVTLRQEGNVGKALQLFSVGAVYSNR